ncbi:peptidylprolyl isomerase [Falsirhodobacter sp. alg1]|uniref:peptidylprolyl isomerase n=1 Tax=Falsirhodobacter sp. alg1 TaxID=1472418 RepID=UPI001EDA1F94|nr:peptidylprolyl isomerase [Falsirhodobacter sp. alg1]
MLMKNMLTATAVALVLATPGFAQDTAADPAPAAASTDATADTVVATVNGKDITLGQMLVLRQRLPAQYQSLPDEALFKGVMEQLIQQQALADSVEGDMTAKDEIAMEIERQSYLASKALEAVAASAVTDESLQAAYDARYANAEPTTEYNASHILVATEDEAKAVKAELDGGADFADVAKEKSTDGAAQNGGELGWFGEGMMVEPFQQAVSSMEVGDISEPVQTQFGWHIIKLNETREAAKPTLDDVRDDLTSELQEQAVTDHLAAMTESADITRPGEGLDPALLRDDSLIDN